MIDTVSGEDDPGSAQVELPDTGLTASRDCGPGIDGNSPAYPKRELKPSRYMQDFVVIHAQPCELASHADAQAADEASLKQTT